MNPLLLAQSAPDASALKGFLEVFFYLGGSIAALLVAWFTCFPRKQADTPQPFVVQQHAEFVQKPDFDKAMREAHGRIGRERTEINAALAAAADTAAAVSAKLDANNEAGREREGRINERIDNLRDTVADMPRRTVELLRQTKGLL